MEKNIFGENVAKKLAKPKKANNISIKAPFESPKYLDQTSLKPSTNFLIKKTK
jgi:hypothetical protein